MSKKRQQMHMDLDLSIATLLPGDIVATNADSKNSAAIRRATKGAFSHAILYRGNGLAIDAMPADGVTKQQLSRKLMGASSANVFRHRTATEQECNKAVSWAALQVGKPYDYNYAAQLGIPGHRTETGRLVPLGFTGILPIPTFADAGRDINEEEYRDNAFFCSEIIIRAFAVAGAPIITDSPAHVVAPGAFLDTYELVHMGALRDVG